MRFLLVALFMTLAAWAFGQNTIHSYSVGNWRNGPVVFISPLIETTEAFTTPQLIAQLKAAHPEFAGITDIDVLRFATAEEGRESRTTLRAKYLQRGLEVVMLEPPAPAGGGKAP